MATPRKVGGYEWRAAIGDANRAVKRARNVLKQILEEKPGQTVTAMYIAHAATALGEIQEALSALNEIGRGEVGGSR